MSINTSNQDPDEHKGENDSLNDSESSERNNSESQPDSNTEIHSTVVPETSHPSDSNSPETGNENTPFSEDINTNPDTSVPESVQEDIEPVADVSDHRGNESEEAPVAENSADKPVKADETEDGHVNEIGSHTVDSPAASNENADLISDTKQSEEIKNFSLPPAEPPKPKESNYQISLIDQNLLKVLVTTKKGVNISSSVREKDSVEETQSNEVHIYPRPDKSLQEIEVLISIEDQKKIPAQIQENVSPQSSQDNPEVPGTVQEESSKEHPEERAQSNFQINLINENLLTIKILTEKSIHIDSVSRDKSIHSQTQSNKIHLKPRSDLRLQEVEIRISIDATAPVSATESEGASEGKSRLIPNPDVVDLIQPPDYSPFGRADGEPIYDEVRGYRNPFDALRKLVRRNLTIGISVAAALHLAAAGVFYFTIGKKAKDLSGEEQSRLIVIQDLPDPKIKLEDIEDPNKPKVTEPPVTEPKTITEPKRELPPRKIVKPPEVIRPKKEPEEVKLDSSVEANLTRKLDSLRKLDEEALAKDTSAVKDTNKAAFEIPDSLRNNFSEKDIGLAMYFPKNWKLTDQRDINKNEKEFKGVVLTDTTAEQPGTMTMFIFLDNENKEYNAEDFKTEFKMLDSTLNAFSKEPKTLAGFTEERFYIFNKLGTEKLSIRASVRKQFFDQYKNEIEAVVRSIRIRKKDDL